MPRYSQLIALTIVFAITGNAIAEDLLSRMNRKRSESAARCVRKLPDLLPANRAMADSILRVIAAEGSLALTEDQTDWVMSHMSASRCGLPSLVYDDLAFDSIMVSPGVTVEESIEYFRAKKVERHWFGFLGAMAAYGLSPADMYRWRWLGRTEKERMRKRRELIRGASDEYVAASVDKYPMLRIAAKEDSTGERLLSRKDFELTDRLAELAGNIRSDEKADRESEQAAAKAREAETKWNAKWGLYHREWTSSAGTKIDAIFVSYADGQITLQGSNQSTITVALDDVSAEDRAFVRDQIRRKAKK